VDNQVFLRGEFRKSLNSFLKEKALCYSNTAGGKAMNRGKKTKKAEMEKRHVEFVRRKKEREAECRRKLLASLSPESKEFTIREFAKLGLTQ
jgi:hypothetical protein